MQTRVFKINQKWRIRLEMWQVIISIGDVASHCLNWRCGKSLSRLEMWRVIVSIGDVAICCLY
jgi:hypothetical protein